MENNINDLLQKIVRICDSDEKKAKALRIIDELSLEQGGIEIRPISVDELSNKTFYIPNYQRGYRWEPKQVEELLQDILDFMLENEDGSYYIQPLVVTTGPCNNCKMNNCSIKKPYWEVIDGQQRLTTIFLITKYLTGPLYTITYETRKGSADFLAKLTTSEDSKTLSESNIDFTHMYEAYVAIDNWVSENLVSHLMRNKFIETLRNRVKFIWYEPQNDNPKDVFTRLNKGRISLTNAELIKALLLNSANYDKGPEIERLQKEIPEKWHEIETTLQNDEFWAFITKRGDNRDSRIDLIFEIIYKNNLLSGANKEEDYGKDGYNTFRYFYSYFRKIGFSRRALDLVWEQIWQVYSTLMSWYEDDVIYNYVGYLVSAYCNYKIPSDRNKSEKEWSSHTVLYLLIKEWGTCHTKSAFIKKLQIRIVEYLKERYNSNKVTGTDGKLDMDSLLDIQYETEDNPKRNCCPILLLHNVQTIVNHIKARRKSKEVQTERFPFHLFNAETWDVEHIASATTNDLTTKGQQNEWIRNVLPFIGDEDRLKLIKYYSKKKIISKDFSLLFATVCSTLSANDNGSDFNKNLIWNYVLLDSHTNRSYGNNLFSIKSRIIKEKENGIRTFCVINNNNSPDPKPITVSTFVPICTKLVFYKYFSKISTDNNLWTEKDAEKYKENIKETLNELINSDEKK